MVNTMMVNPVHGIFISGERAKPADLRQLARTSLVNHGQDTKFTFRDGSTIVLKGVRQIDAVFAATGGSPSGPSPIGANIGRNR
jgi:hypothetical protein